MEIVNIKLNEKQKSNLLAFLARVQLAATEAREFLNICEIIDKAKVVEETTDIKKGDK
jgi:hypothetical protein